MSLSLRMHASVEPRLCAAEERAIRESESRFAASAAAPLDLDSSVEPERSEREQMSMSQMSLSEAPLGQRSCPPRASGMFRMSVSVPVASSVVASVGSNDHGMDKSRLLCSEQRKVIIHDLSISEAKSNDLREPSDLLSHACLPDEFGRRAKCSTEAPHDGARRGYEDGSRSGHEQGARERGSARVCSAPEFASSPVGVSFAVNQEPGQDSATRRRRPSFAQHRGNGSALRHRDGRRGRRKATRGGCLAECSSRAAAVPTRVTGTRPCPQGRAESWESTASMGLVARFEVEIFSRHVTRGAPKYVVWTPLDDARDGVETEAGCAMLYD
jgi:hypothetical protein